MDNRQQLVESIFERKVDPALMARLQPALTGLDTHRFTSTDEFAIRRRWEGLCEKFSIHGYGEAATRLRLLKDKFMDDTHSIGDSCTSISSQHVLKYDMLALLLALSSGSPSEALNNETSSSRDTVQESGADFWRRTLLEEPLEGDHWQQYESDDEDEDMMSMDGEEEQDLELDQEELARFKARSTTQQEPFRSTSPTDERWFSTYAPLIEHDQEDMIRNEDHVQRYWEDPEVELTEADIMREVMFMLRGLPSVLFEKTLLENEGVTTSKLQVAAAPSPLGHLSNIAVKSILNEFNDYGNTLNNLREWVQRVIRNSRMDDHRYGQTCEAFAVCVTRMFQAFERHMSSIEIDYCQTQGSKPIISILKLKNTLDPTLKAFQEVYKITTHLHISDSPRAISQTLLSTIYSRICETEMQGKQDANNVLVYLYRETIKPFAQLLDDWTTRATLKGDVTQEFFISRSNRRDSEFIEDEFYVHEPSDDDVISGYPLLDRTFMDKVFFVGKAIEIISRFRDEMESIPTYIDCFDKIIPIPKTVFDSSSGNSPQPFQPALSQQSPFLLAGFPLLKNDNQHLIQTSSSINTTITPYLFDQAILQSLDDYIAEPYLHATQKLRVVLYESCSLISHLCRIASIYLMLEDELMHIFCETLFQKMDKGIYPENSSTNTQIDKLFMDAKSAIGGLHQDLTLSECSFDHNADGSFLDKIRFSYHLPWPINNYIRRSSLRKYSLITTLLLRLKRTKHLLDRKTLTQQKRSMKMLSMRVRLIWFVNSFSSYIMTTVLHTETMALRTAIHRLENMDDMVQLHADYVDRIVDRCLLGDKTRSIHAAILRILDQVQDLAQMFIQPDVETSAQFTETMENMEKKFVRDNEFISTSLAIIGKKGNFPWFDALAATLSSHGNTAYS
ncbi:hypothetical protein K492DRAFT_210069 [Lichtheimia hyalospora FSU 10163]|nr:hypothetical protein K492DRAFT_210069 [Lichtheimia hyalospora FSU 10163]